jgi:hypothetical protein
MVKKKLIVSARKFHNELRSGYHSVLALFFALAKTSCWTLVEWVRFREKVEPVFLLHEISVKSVCLKGAVALHPKAGPFLVVTWAASPAIAIARPLSPVHKRDEEPVQGDGHERRRGINGSDFIGSEERLAKANLLMSPVAAPANGNPFVF